MKKIKLTQGRYALVDDSDFEELNKYKWYADKGIRNKSYYAVRARPKKEKGTSRIKMHIEIMGKQAGFEIDHIDRDGLNNQRKNLRFCTPTENKRNVCLRYDNTSGFKGVSWDKSSQRWRARISIERKRINLGLFDSKLKAYEIYCKACIKYHGNFARIK